MMTKKKEEEVEEKKGAPREAFDKLFKDWNSLSSRRIGKKYSVADLDENLISKGLYWRCVGETCSHGCPFKINGKCESSSDITKIILKIIQNGIVYEKYSGYDFGEEQRQEKERIEIKKQEAKENKARAAIFASLYRNALKKFDEEIGKKSFTSRVILDMSDDMSKAAASEIGMCSVCARYRYCTRTEKGKRKPCEEFEYLYVKRFTSFESAGADDEIISKLIGESFNESDENSEEEQE